MGFEKSVKVFTVMVLAMEDVRRAIRHPAATFYPHATLVAALALLDRREEAIKPDFSPHAVRADLSPLNPDALRPYYKTWLDGLRKAGLDILDEPTVTD